MTMRSMVIASAAAIALFAALTTAGCTQTPTSGWPELPPTADVVPFDVVGEVHTSQHSAIQQRQRRVLKTVTEWETFWAEFHGPVEPKPPAPIVDFASRMVLVAAMGQRNTGGFGVSIVGVFSANGALVVRVEERSPGPNCFVTQALTAPVTAAIVTRSDAVVEFVERAVATECG